MINLNTITPVTKRRWDENDIMTIKTGDALIGFLASGLRDLYAEAFGDEPYNEVFANGEIDEIFNDYLNSNGEIMVLPEQGRPIAFMVGTPLKRDFTKVCGIPANIPLSKIAYIAEDGVASTYRRLGISTMMKGALLDRYASQGFEQAILRTSAANTPQIQAVLAAGGQTITGAQQMVERTTKFGKVMEDNRFFRFDLTRR